MPTELPADQDPLAQRLQHMESSIQELNARIARLAIALGVSLKNDAEIGDVMTRHEAMPASAERRGTPDRRVAHQREELRGLLVLRYGVETRFVDEVGVTVTREILVEAEAQLVRAGFKPGADGIDLDRLFKKP